MSPPTASVSTAGQVRVVDRLAHRSGPKRSIGELTEPLSGDGHVLVAGVASVACASMHLSRDDSRSDPHVRVQNDVAGIGHGEHQTLDQLDWELARVDGLFGGLLLTLGISQTSLGFLPNGLHDNSPAFGPLKCRLPGYFGGTLMGSRCQV